MASLDSTTKPEGSEAMLCMLGSADAGCGSGSGTGMPTGDTTGVAAGEAVVVAGDSGTGEAGSDMGWERRVGALAARSAITGSRLLGRGGRLGLKPGGGAGIAVGGRIPAPVARASIMFG